MRARRYQTTLARPCSVSGRGYWSGEPNTLTFLPAPPNSGVRFFRDDLQGRPSVSASSEFRASMPLRTRLECGRAQVDMVEHVMAALAGLQIDNVEVHCTACEMPAMDGSCLALALHIQNAERLVQPAPKTALRITEVFRVGNDQQWITVEPFDAELTDASRSIYEYQLDFGAQSPIAPSTYTWELNPDTFVSEVAPARTFISLNEARLLQSQGLAQHVTERDLIVFDEHGPVANELRFVDECTRHKTLDLIGDLALAGCDLEGRVIAHRSGHQLNGLMAQTLRDHMLAMLTPSQSYRRRAA